MGARASCLARRESLQTKPGMTLDLAVNVSARQLMSPDFRAIVASVLERTEMDPSSLILEVTESLFIEDFDYAIDLLGNLRALGVRLALDDSGTGFSSLSYLRRLPIDIIKIDQSFIADIGELSTGSAVVAAVTNLAHVLGLAVTAEGVETHAQRNEIAASVVIPHRATFSRDRPTPRRSCAAAIDDDLRKLRLLAWNTNRQHGDIVMRTGTDHRRHQLVAELGDVQRRHLASSGP